MVDGYVSSEELAILQQLEYNIELATFNNKGAELVIQKVHAEKKATEAELRAAQAEYNGAMMKILWKYKLDGIDSIRISDGLIVKGKENDKQESNINE